MPATRGTPKRPFPHPVTVSAFDAPANPGNVRFNAVYGSDIGHWDVPT
jgi:hypothetical protein